MRSFYETVVGRGVPEDDIFENLNVMSDLQGDLETYGKMYQSDELSRVMAPQQVLEVQTLLAQRCDNFAYDYDPYGYHDDLNGTREDSVNAIRDDLAKGHVKVYLTGIDSMGLGISDSYVSKYETIDMQVETNKIDVSKRKLPENGEEMLQQLESEGASDTYQR